MIFQAWISAQKSVTEDKWPVNTRCRLYIRTVKDELQLAKFRAVCLCSVLARGLVNYECTGERLIDDFVDATSYTAPAQREAREREPAPQVFTGECGDRPWRPSRHPVLIVNQLHAVGQSEQSETGRPISRRGATTAATTVVSLTAAAAVRGWYCYCGCAVTFSAIYELRYRW